MRKFVLIAFLAPVWGCVAEKTYDEMNYTERQEVAAKLVQACRDQGITEDAELARCFEVEAERDIERRDKAAENRDLWLLAVSAGMKGYGDGMARSSANYRSPVRCISNRIGNTVNTSCY